MNWTAYWQYSVLGLVHVNIKNKTVNCEIEESAYWNSIHSLHYILPHVTEKYNFKHTGQFNDLLAWFLDVIKLSWF